MGGRYAWTNIYTPIYFRRVSPEMSELNYGQFNISQQLAVFVNSLYVKNKCLCFVHKGLCSNPCIQDECLQGLAVGAIRR